MIERAHTDSTSGLGIDMSALFAESGFMLAAEAADGELPGGLGGESERLS